MELEASIITEIMTETTAAAGPTPTDDVAKAALFDFALDRAVAILLLLLVMASGRFSPYHNIYLYHRR
jgi:hypothetical protein